PSSALPPGDHPCFRILRTGFTIGRPEYSLGERRCLSYGRKGDQQAFCAATRAYCEQRVRKLSLQEKLITPCPDFETVICWPDRSGTLAPLGPSPTLKLASRSRISVTPANEERPQDSGGDRASLSSHDGAAAFGATGTGGRMFVSPPVREEGRGTDGRCGWGS